MRCCDPRRVIGYPGIDAAKAKRRADEEKWQAEIEKRRATAQAKHDRRANELAHAYRTAPRHTATDEVPRLA
jgi:hypothetical protein